MINLLPSTLPWQSKRAVAVLALAIPLCCAFRSTHAQAPQPPSASPNDPTGIASSSGPANQDNSSTVAPLSGTSNALTAQQIDDVLQSKPEIVVELKQLVADQLQQQGSQEGVQIQSDSITDEMLYNQIATNPSLRIAITNFLRARGYISDQDLQRARTGANDDEQDASSSSAGTLQALQAQAQLPGAMTQLGASTEAPSRPDDILQNSSGRLPDGTRAPLSSSSRSNTAAAQRLLRETVAHNTTDEPQVLHRPAPYNLLALRDLYTQIPEEEAHLKRFGSEVFLSRTNTSRPATSAQENPLDIPIGPDYVVGPGDSLSIDLWGGISQNFTRVIDREGRISLPESGAISIAGLTMEHAQQVIEGTLTQQYRNAKVAVTVSRLRSVRVYVVGDVQRPGAYDISSLATPLNALYAAGGPTAIGSLRTLQHFRGKQLIAEIDLYDFLLHGVRIGDDRFQGGDTLFVPPAGPQVAVSGAVKRPAIYELNHQTTLAEVLADAGGATVAASLGHITVERIEPNQHRETVTLDLANTSTAASAKTAISTFIVRDGDRIHLSPILPFSERVIYLEGHVLRPGRIAYRERMHLNDVLRSYQDLLPEPAALGEIVRLVPPDLHAETIDFNLAEALIGNANLELRPFDTIRILGRYDYDSPRVTIRGEVLRPGDFPLSQGMTAAQLVRMAGGFRRAALQQTADLTSYQIINGSKVLDQRSSIRIGDAVNRNDSSADVVLKPGDILTIYQITGWTDIGSSLTIKGEVSHPGSYGFQEGERLSSVLRRAGGFRDTAYPAGAVLLREQVKELEEKSRAELIRQVEASPAASRLTPSLSGNDNSATLQLIQQQQDQVLARLRSQPATGRLVIHVTSDIDSWANTDVDIEVRRGDVLTIPKRPGFVLVSGQVYNASAITFVPSKTAKWYLQRAGGVSDLANRKEIFIIRANGTVIGRHSGAGPVLSAQLEAGDVVFVPQKIFSGSQVFRNLLTVAQIASSAAITAVVVGL